MQTFTYTESDRITHAHTCSQFSRNEWEDCLASKVVKELCGHVVNQMKRFREASGVGTKTAAPLRLRATWQLQC